MKTARTFILITLLQLICLGSSFAQTTIAKQSAVYEAIALLNARHHIKGVILPDVTGMAGNSSYQVIDPLTGHVDRGLSGALPAAYTCDDATATDIIRQILARNAGLPTTATPAQVQTAYQNNQFFTALLTGTTVNFAANSNNLAASMTGVYVDPRAGSVGSNLLNNLANGTADFLIKRAGEELSIAVFQKLKDFLAKYPEFAVLFPKTTALIKPVIPYEYAKTLNALKAALQEDLSKLTGNVQYLYGIPRYQLLNEQVPALTLVFSSTAVINELHGRNGLSKTLHDLDTCTFLNAANNYASFVKVLSLTSDALRKRAVTDPDNGDYNYISLSEIDQLTGKNTANKAELLRYLLGFLYQSGQTIPVYSATGSQTAGQLISNWATASDINIAALLDKVGASAGKLQELTDQLAALKNQDAGTGQITGKAVFSTERFTAYNQLLITALQLCEPYVTNSAAPTQFQQDFKLACDYWPPFSSGGVDLINAISQKNYSLAAKDLGNLLDVVTQFLDSKKDDKTYVNTVTTALQTDLNGRVATITASITTLNQQIANLKSTAAPAGANQNTVNSQIQQLQVSLKKLQDQQTIVSTESKDAKNVIFALSKVIEYYQLLAALSEANNSQEVETLLETYALPAGSSRVKKETDFNIAVNAYVGGFFARGSTLGQGFSNQYGFTAPIGFTISHGMGKVGSLSLLAAPFDIGSVIQYKLNNQGAYEQDINLAGLVSPGAHFVYGFPFYFPLSFGIGCQWTAPPTTPVNQISLSPHFNAFIAVDIPLFNLSVIKKKP
ncbi:hypothetical protein LX99_04533 [Mucilaginibacter oryzae]|uniref:Uncharacterized protein n=1 Tax=Mucilaginibacter oryzae TaxID=468058 RepID=A0A316H4S3_9SPHI|nr:hypothetical protein [Mucilaginibacter oryzae]PWK70826.1 hypothetical protein LX99_04533 [Mucilaginibacter oryzae]